MATISFHGSDGTARATFDKYTIAAGELGALAERTFGVLKIITDRDAVEFFVKPERFDWAVNVAAAINAPVLQSVQVAA